MSAQSLCARFDSACNRSHRGFLAPVGFYNTFFARRPAEPPHGVEIASEPDGRVTALRAERFCSFQFHVESVLTTNSVPLLRDALLWVTMGLLGSVVPPAMSSLPPER